MVKTVFMLLAVGMMTGLVVSAAGQTDNQADAAFGIRMPAGYRDWRLISVAREEGHLDDIRAILGNDIAIKAYRETDDIAAQIAAAERERSSIRIRILRRSSTCSA